MIQWEYQSIKTVPEDLPAQLDTLGRQGWEVFQLNWEGPWVYVWMKRPVAE